MQKKLLLLALIVSAGATVLPGQVYRPQKPGDNLAQMIPRLFGPHGLVLPNDFHQNSSFSQEAKSSQGLFAN